MLCHRVERIFNNLTIQHLICIYEYVSAHEYVCMKSLKLIYSYSLNINKNYIAPICVLLQCDDKYAKRNVLICSNNQNAFFNSKHLEKKNVC